jgi:hypothetical protein
LWKLTLQLSSMTIADMDARASMWKEVEADTPEKVGI